LKKEKITRKDFLAWGRQNSFNTERLKHNNSLTRFRKILQNSLLQTYTQKKKPFTFTIKIISSSKEMCRTRKKPHQTKKKSE
jgi:hypothetical protein